MLDNLNNHLFFHLSHHKTYIWYSCTNITFLFDKIGCHDIILCCYYYHYYFLIPCLGCVGPCLEFRSLWSHVQENTVRSSFALKQAEYSGNPNCYHHDNFYFCLKTEHALSIYFFVRFRLAVIFSLISWFYFVYIKKFFFFFRFTAEFNPFFFSFFASMIFSGLLKKFCFSFCKIYYIFYLCIIIIFLSFWYSPHLQKEHTLESKIIYWYVIFLSFCLRFSIKSWLLVCFSLFLSI